MNRATRLFAAIVVLLGIALVLVQSGLATTRPLIAQQFVEIAPQGFGDSSNSGVWSMQWWRGQLYAGTVREFDCWSQASLHNLYPFLAPYPPRDPDKECAPNVEDLALRAEIWRYTPETDAWERLFQSPEDVPIPANPDKFTARDVGFRGMGIFTEPDGTEVLYVSGVYPHIINPAGYPRPRILRSEDGETFEEIPQDAGTFLGDLANPSFRGIVTYNSRLYIIAASIWGSGAVLEAENPAGGNDNFRQITPSDMEVFELIPYNGYLYVGTTTQPIPPPPPPEEPVDQRSQPLQEEEPVEGYSILRTDASGAPPFMFTEVITGGGYTVPRSPSEGVISMHVFGGRLYVGTDSPAEIVRINPDDSWDVVIGDRRNSPDGYKRPLSGLDAGFGWIYNIHIWRMQEHEGVLYVGTADLSTRLRTNDALAEQFGDRFGFDLYATTDGVYFTPITINGLGDMFQMGARSFASTPHGLFLGSVNYWDGLRVWLGWPHWKLYIPFISGSGQGAANIQDSGPIPSPLQVPGYGDGFPQAPGRLEAEVIRGDVVLSWQLPREATRFHVFRSQFTSNRVLGIRDLDADAWVPGPYVEIGTTDQFYFVDRNTLDEARYYYYVLAEDSAGRFSQASNLARAPSLASMATFDDLRGTIVDWAGRGRFKTRPGKDDLDLALTGVSDLVGRGDLTEALRWLEQLRLKVQQNQPAIVDPWYARDLEIMLSRLARRIQLVQAGLLSPPALE